ncbi:MAG: hypothetical protein Q9157_008284 [Trypethelium eluteriae]
MDHEFWTIRTGPSGALLIPWTFPESRILYENTVAVVQPELMWHDRLSERVQPPRREYMRVPPRKDPRSFSQNLFDRFELDRAGVGVPKDLENVDLSGSDASVDSLSNLTPELCRALSSLHSYQFYDSPTTPDYIRTNKEHRNATRDYIEQSIFYCFARADSAIKIAGEYFNVDMDQRDAAIASRFTRLKQFHQGLENLTSHYAKTMFDSLWEALAPVFAKPELINRKRQASQYLNDEQVAPLLALCIHALSAAVDLDDLTDHDADETDNLRYHGFLPLRDENATWSAERLAGRLARAIYARHCFAQASSRMHGVSTLTSCFTLLKVPLGLPRLVFRKGRDNQDKYEDRGIPANMFLRWTKFLFVQAWDGASVIQGSTPAGFHLRVLNLLYTWAGDLGLREELFRVPAVSDELNFSKVSCEWPLALSNVNAYHILQSPFLFTKSKLISCFRAVNLSNMTQAFVKARTAMSLPKRLQIHVEGRQADRLSSLLATEKNAHLALEVRRGHELDDAMDQIWQRSKEELSRPLKVHYVGEQGFDIGGVSQEFFSSCFTAALDPNYGMSSVALALTATVFLLAKRNCANRVEGLFTINERTHHSWFRPLSDEPSYRFELLGILVSLAVYSGFVLPFSFPIAFYLKLLDMPVVSIEHIRDGWPELSRGLEALRDWDHPELEVEDAFMRSYVFTIETPGENVDVQIDKFGRLNAWPDPELAEEDGYYAERNPLPLSHRAWRAPRTGPSNELTEPKMVTNKNRRQYIADYIWWLTHKSIEGAFTAFSSGFFTCIDKTNLKILTPEVLQLLVEGDGEVDVDVLEDAAEYESIDRSHPLIRGFWRIVKAYDNDQKRKLLEFVTASDRMPVGSPARMTFVIQKNGPDTENLPTSTTCFSRLLLPEYSSVEKLKMKLAIALENTKGFGND